jgi:hypothetical protein
MLRARRTRRIRTARLGVVALAAAVLSLVAVPAAQAGAGSTPPPPAQNPQVTEVSGMWGAQLVSAQDRPNCPGRIATSGASGFEQFRESRETWSTEFSSSSDPRYDGSITFYLHMLRNVSTQNSGPIGEVDGTYAVFDGSGRAIAHGFIQGVLVRETGSGGGETELQGMRGISQQPGIVRLQGLFFGGQVLFPSAATVGRPYLLANYLSFFQESTIDPNHNFDQWFGLYGDEGLGNGEDDISDALDVSTDSIFGAPSLPAIVVGGTCPGTYRNRTVSAPVATPARARRTRSQAAFVRRLYEDAR